MRATTALAGSAGGTPAISVTRPPGRAHPEAHSRGATPRPSASALAGDAQPGGRQRLQALLRDRLAALLAPAVRPGFHAVQRGVDLAQRVAQALDHREQVDPLRRGLPGVGEPGLQQRVLDAVRVVAGAEVLELPEELLLLAAEPLAQHIRLPLVHRPPPFVSGCPKLVGERPQRVANRALPSTGDGMMPAFAVPAVPGRLWARGENK